MRLVVTGMVIGDHPAVLVTLLVSIVMAVVSA
jgi:hypothetical protein